ncbi:MAG: metallophosphoesterase, partial [Planctomycetes bacterium]|nr:metallophosphoesterase [Planctomycetota bacterium]
ALIGVSTARPSSPTLALGTIGPDQLEGLHRHLRVSGARGLFRVVYMHHPPVEGVVGWRKRLTDRVELERVLADAGVELLLHGHAHRPSRTTMVLGDRRIPVLGVPALSESVPGHRRGGSYNRMRIERDGQGWKLRISERRFDPESGDFSAGATEVVMVAR